MYCEANFGAIDGKTANGLVRHSEMYDIVAVIDSHKAGLDSGLVLDDEPNAIPICFDLEAALAHAGRVPDYFIFGIAPSSGMLSAHERGLVLQAIGLGMDIVSGLHEFLADDPEFAAASAASDVRIRDVRKPRATKDLRVFSGRISEVDCPRIAILGTDCAIGKRTTATILTQALLDQGLKAVMVGTGQTGLMQGARYGVALDAVPTQFCAGELEATILRGLPRREARRHHHRRAGRAQPPGLLHLLVHPPRRLPAGCHPPARSGSGASLRLPSDGHARARRRRSSSSRPSRTPGSSV